MIRSDIELIIKEIDSINIIQLLKMFESSNDILLLKFDGVREVNKHTVMIMGKESRFTPIRYEGDDINVGLLYCLNEYLKYLPL